MRAKPNEFATELVVGQFRNEEGVLLHGPSEPHADVRVLARVADLPEDARIQ